MSKIKIEGPKKGNFTASGHGMSAIGLSPVTAELNLLRKIISIFETKIVIQDWMPEEKRKEKIIKSSNIYKIEWDQSNLWVHYNNESVYQYKDIPESISIAVGEAKSAGSFLHRKVKGNYRYERIH